MRENNNNEKKHQILYTMGAITSRRKGVVAVGTFAKHCKPERSDSVSSNSKSPPEENGVSRRRQLNSFIRRMKAEKEDIKNEVTMKSMISLRPQSAKKKPVRDTDKKIWDKDLTDSICHLCKKSMVQYEDKPYPCRVCPRVFHFKCLKGWSACRPFDLEAADRVDTNVGWSCYTCSNISLLLTDREMEQMVELFDNNDINGDTTWTLTDYLRVNMERIEKTQGYPPTADDEDMLLFSFKMMDHNQDGRLDWWEFIIQASKRILSKRKKEDLVDLLTEKEIIYAKSTFQFLDKNDDGTVTGEEADRAIRQWFRNAGIGEEKLNPGVYRETSDLDRHSAMGIRMLMDGDKDNSGTITWEEYITEQALYILCSRPNELLSF